MLRKNNNYREKYKANDPYIKQSPLQDVTIPNYSQYEDSVEEHYRDPYRLYEYGYPQYDMAEIRSRRAPRPDTPEESEPQPPTERPPKPPTPPPVNEPPSPPVYEKYLTPLYVITAFFTAMLIFGPLLVRKGPNRGLVQACIMLTAFCMWIFWFTIYFGQMNPLMGPRLENTTVAWIAYKLGNPLNTSEG